jgi:formyltetrahydrofolate hydrolase
MMNVVWFILGLIITFLVNIPFGFWRAHAKKTGNKLEWILAVHLPVPLVVLLRYMAGLSWNREGAPFILIFVLAYFLGQKAGGKLYTKAHERGLNPGRNIAVLWKSGRGLEGEAV